MLITFSGLDGAGKSTLIRALQSKFDAAGVRSVSLTMYDNVGLYALLRGLRDWVCGSSFHGRADGGRVTGEVQQESMAMKCIRSTHLKRLLLFLDIGILLAYRLVIEAIFRRVIILDRYFYDSLVEVSAGAVDRFVLLCVAVVPQPSAAFFVDVPAEIAFARKGEYSVAELTARRQVYAAMFSAVRVGTRVDNLDLESAVTAIWETVTRARTLQW